MHSRRTRISSTIAMERRTNGGAAIVAILVVLVVANGVDSEMLYQCYGACYNNCFIKNGKTQTGGLPCEYQCLNKCMSPSSIDVKLYCQLGCSLKRCIPVSTDGAKKEKCFGWCTNLCNQLLPA